MSEVIVLGIAVCALSIACSVLASSLPFLWWKCLRLEADLKTLDEALSELLASVFEGGKPPKK